MSIIKENCEVEIEYSLTTESGDVVDSSDRDGPLKYIHGKKRISPQLEAGLAGKKVGDQVKIVVPPEDAYGVRDEELVKFAAKEFFGEGFKNISEGMPLEITGPGGDVVIVMATEVREDGVIIDGNHPYAGKTLTYHVKVKSVKSGQE